MTCYLCDKWYLEELYKYENIGYGHKAVKRLKEILEKNGLKPLAKKIKTSYPSISDPEAKKDDEQSTEDKTGEDSTLIDDSETKKIENGCCILSMPTFSSETSCSSWNGVKKYRCSGFASIIV